jgi:hypothetical protein
MRGKCARGTRRIPRRAPADADGAAAPPQRGTGTWALPSQGSGYVHPETGTAIPAVSLGWFQPLPTLGVAVAAGTPLVLVNVGAGSVGIGPVAEYDGTAVTGPALAMVVGGQAIAGVALGAMLVALGRPVDERGNLFWQVPSAVRGSAGIHFCCRPSWYDHAGAMI